jgi:MFS family permease
VNIGVLVACGAYYFWSEQKWPVRSVFLIGILPALIVFWIRRAVPETAEWHTAKNTAVEQPRVRSLFEGEVLKTTLLTIAVCATSLSAWWAFMFWNNQHMRNLPDVASWTDAEKAKLVSKAFFMVIAVSSVGNFFAGWLAQKISYRRAITIMSMGFLAAFIFTFYKPRTHQEMLFCVPMIGFCSGMFGLFTMYMPPLFPTLLRTTGAGFCYNIGRIAAALGTIYFGTKANVGDFRLALLYAGFLFIPTILVSLVLPEPRSLRE